MLNIFICCAKLLHEAVTYEKKPWWDFLHPLLHRHGVNTVWKKFGNATGLCWKDPVLNSGSYISQSYKDILATYIKPWMQIIRSFGFGPLDSVLWIRSTAPARLQLVLEETHHQRSIPYLISDNPLRGHLWTSVHHSSRRRHPGGSILT